MNKLSKEDIARRDEIMEDLENQKEIIEAEWLKVTSAAAVYNAAVGRYNEHVAEATSFADDMVNAMEDYISEKSEKWADGDKGQAYDSWKSEWESVDLTEIDLFEPEHDVQFDHKETLENLPDRPE